MRRTQLFRSLFSALSARNATAFSVSKIHISPQPQLLPCLFIGKAGFTHPFCSVPGAVTTEPEKTAEEPVSTIPEADAVAQSDGPTVEDVKLYVGNLPFDITDESLGQLFQDYNPVRVNIVTRTGGQSRGYGFVDFATPEEATEARSALDGQMVDGRMLRVNNKNSPNAARKPREGVSKRKVYIGNFPWDMDVVDLQELCNQFGDVARANIVLDENTGLSRGYGFVLMKTEDCATQLINNLDQTMVGGRILSVNKAGTRTEARRNKQSRLRCKVYMGNLSWGMEVEDLEELCGKFGAVSSARIAADKDSGLSLGFGFVTMSSETEAQDLIKALDQTDVDGRVLNVGLARSEAERKEAKAVKETEAAAEADTEAAVEADTEAAVEAAAEGEEAPEQAEEK